MRREPSLPASLVIAAWMVVDAWLIYGVAWWVFR